MKKKIFSVLAIAIIACMCVFGLAACNDGNGSGEVINVAGKTFVFESLKITCPGMSEEQLKEAENIAKETFNGMKFDFGTDGKCKMIVAFDGNETVETADYKQEGNTITITSEGVPMSFIVKDGKLVITQENSVGSFKQTAVIVFKQQQE